MKHLKTFEAYVGPIFPNSKFNQEDMDELYEIFQDFAVTYNIKDMTIKTSSLIPSQFDDDPDTGEVNQYFIGQARNAFIDIRLFDNIEEIIETLRDNFIPQVKSLGWYIPSVISPKIGPFHFNGISSYMQLKDGMVITNDENDIETPYTEVSITFAKKDI
jgi:hypothetical protein